MNPNAESDSGDFLTLREKRVAFTLLVAEMIHEATVLGYEIALNEVLRSAAAAIANANAGKGISNSLHRIGLAVDVALYRQGVYLKDSEDYRDLGLWWEAQSTPEYTLCWGGRWNDGNHLSMMHEGIR